jgi:alpha-beta hydrolase superfamily lysophospholipase
LSFFREVQALIWRLIALGCILALAACAATEAPPGDAPGPPHLADAFFVTRDGMRLPLRHWEAEGKPRAVILALHGMSDYSNAFDMPARQWAKSGIATLAFDQRGFGAGPNPGLWAGSAVMRDDLADFTAAARMRYPGIPLFALGESMGGAVLLSALADGAPPLDGVILVAPAVWSRGDMPALYRVALFLAAHLTPGLILSNSAASHVVTIVPSDNIEMMRALARDPLFQKQTRADALFGLVNLMDEARAAPKKLPAKLPPILLMTGKKDQIIPQDATAGVIADLGGHAELRRYDDGYHMLLRDLEGPKVNQDLADWVLSKLPEEQGQSGPKQ